MHRFSERGVYKLVVSELREAEARKLGAARALMRNIGSRFFQV